MSRKERENRFEVVSQGPNIGSGRLSNRSSSLLGFLSGSFLGKAILVAGVSAPTIMGAVGVSNMVSELSGYPSAQAEQSAENELLEMPSEWFYADKSVNISELPSSLYEEVLGSYSDSESNLHVADYAKEYLNAMDAEEILKHLADEQIDKKDQDWLERLEKIGRLQGSLDGDLHDALDAGASSLRLS